MKKADHIYRLYAGGPFFSRFLARWRSLVSPFEPLSEYIPQSSEVLDIGCGIGVFLAHLAHEGHIRSGTGTDVNPAAIATARAMAGTLKREFDQAPDLHFSLEQGSTPGFANLFDVVTLIDVLHHVPPADRDKFVAAAASRVKPGGILLIKDMDPRTALCRITNRLHDLLLARQWVHYVELGMIDALLNNLGLKLEQQRYYARGPYAHMLFSYRKEG